MSDEATETPLILSDDEVAWLTEHLESRIASKPVNTEPVAHGIVSKLHGIASTPTS